MAEVSLRDRRQALLDQPGLRGRAFCRAYAEAADAWLSGLADRAERRQPPAAGPARGRRLRPRRALPVQRPRRRPRPRGRRDVAKLADAIWYPVWDQGVHLDHSVRRPSEVVDAAVDDLRVALGLLDARLVWGDARVAEPLLAKATELWRSRLGATWLPALAAQMAERRRTYGDLAFLLEPDLKDSHGGLRDVNVLRAVAAYAPLLADYVDLASLEPAAGLLTGDPRRAAPERGRELDRLLLQDQDHIAAVLDYADADGLMAAVAEAGRTVAWVSEDAWRRQRLWQPDTGRGRGRGRFGRRSTAVGDGPPPADGEVEPGVAIVQRRGRPDAGRRGRRRLVAAVPRSPR